jgi:hypothetical protein
MDTKMDGKSSGGSGENRDSSKQGR